MEIVKFIAKNFIEVEVENAEMKGTKKWFDSFMKNYDCTISQKNLNDFVSVFQVKADNLKQAKDFARMHKTNYFQKVEVRLSKPKVFKIK